MSGWHMTSASQKHVSFGTAWIINFNTLCRALIAVRSTLVGGGLLEVCFCVCLRGADEKGDLITRYSVLFYSCLEDVQMFHLGGNCLICFLPTLKRVVNRPENNHQLVYFTLLLMGFLPH